VFGCGMGDIWRAGHKDPSFWWLSPVLAKKNVLYQTLVDLSHSLTKNRWMAFFLANKGEYNLRHIWVSIIFEVYTLKWVRGLTQE